MNLLRFEYSDLLLVKTSFLNVPKLQEVCFSVYRERDMHYIFQQLAKDLPNLRMLHVSISTKLVREKNEKIIVASFLK